MSHKSCGKGAHHGYNCPLKVLIISKPEPCNNQTVDELPQTLPSFDPTCYSGDGNSFTYDSTPNFVNDFPNVFNPPPQPQYVPYSCELCGNDSHHGYDCPPQVSFVYNQDPCFNQNFDYFPQTSPSFPQQYPCCEDCGGPHETFQCQPMNYYKPNPCYDSNYSGFDQTQPPQYTVNHPIFNAQNELLNYQNKIMEQMTSIYDMIPICYDDDEDNTIAVTPVLSVEEPVDSLIMEDEHLDAIPEMESDKVIKSSVEDLIPIPKHSEIVVNFSDDSTSSDDDYPYGEDIDYVDASPPDAEIVSSEVVEIVVPEVGGIDTDILLTIKDDILHEK
ncbi:hypothetical protein Tco_1033429, partial [Tanacetum coccineum]